MWEKYITPPASSGLNCFFYLNFEDTRLIDFESSDFTELEEGFI
jgi:hypothetical protein